MKTSIFIALCSSFFVSLSSYAGCNLVAKACTENLCIDISDGWCDYPEIMITTWEIRNDKNGQEQIVKTRIKDSRQQHSFLKECEFVKDGFSCSKSGSTILAGRTYKIETHGKRFNPYGQIWVPAHRYVCIKGCSETSSFKYLEIVEDQG